ncbi:hypothetical protein [Cephaloticoccus primus]|uniref:hypothetical protein n=1 Tax=Cephaloticoccus primus TaxID=1548207 RepID=UPI0012E84941|nr:hypothetical protein [Cephaloticoccus primus]
MPIDSDQESALSLLGDEPFPAKRVFLAALFPALFGMIVGFLIVPPQVGFDPAAGLRAWVNFMNGGTWNTISVPDPNNIAQTTEVAVTWWPPGQYLFHGLLNLAGLSLAHAALLLAFLCSLSGCVGSAVLAAELGAPGESLPWIAAAVGCSSQNLTGFIGYWGGEPLIMALWPWVAVIAWKLRNRSILLVCTLPILFVIGSYIKYSFAIYAICILLFLWSERLVGLSLEGLGGASRRIGDVIRVSFPLVIVGLLYVILRHCFLSGEGSPLQGWEHRYSLREILAYTPMSPLTSVSNFQEPIVRAGIRFLHKEYDDVWLLVASIFVWLSPFAIILYVYFVFQRRPLLRFAGIAALTTVVVFSTFYILGYSVALRDRYYQQAGILLSAVVVVYAFEKRKFSILTQVFVFGVMIFGVLKFSRSVQAVEGRSPPAYIGVQGFAFITPPRVINELRLIATHRSSIIAISNPALALELDFVRHPSTHIFPTYGNGIKVAPSYKGRVSQITIAEPIWSQRNLRSRFVDYTEDEWTCYTVDDWVFWQTGYSRNEGE